MSAPSLTTAGEIEALERRLDRRRDAFAQRYDDVRDGVNALVAKTARSWPMMAVVGGLATGFVIARGGSRRRAREETVRYVPVNALRTEPSMRVDRRMNQRNMLAALAGIVATGIRIGASREARIVFDAVRRFRARRDVK